MRFRNYVCGGSIVLGLLFGCNNIDNRREILLSTADIDGNGDNDTLFYRYDSKSRIPLVELSLNKGEYKTVLILSREPYDIALRDFFRKWGFDS